MSNDSITSDAVWSYIDSHRRVHGTMPRLREVVEHFDGKLLNVLLCLGELGAERAGAIRKAAAADADARRKRRIEKARIA